MSVAGRVAMTPTVISSPNKRFDVLGLGCAAVDDLLYVPSFPPADGKVRVDRTAQRCGGLTGAALVTAARLGARCAYAGWLGTDEHSDLVARNFIREGVDVSLAPRSPEARVVHSTIVVGEDSGSRNVFFEDAGRVGAHPSLPAVETIRDCRVLFIDHSGMAGNVRAARAARSDGVAVVADFEVETDPLFRDVLDLVDHLVLSEAFACRITRTPDAPRAATALWRADRAAVVVTCGGAGCWTVSAESASAVRLHPAFAVKAADTTGCGDAFHGAYAVSLARGEGLADRIRFASATAALKAQEGEFPRRNEVDQFLAARVRSAAPA